MIKLNFLKHLEKLQQIKPQNYSKKSQDHKKQQTIKKIRQIKNQRYKASSQEKKSKTFCLELSDYKVNFNHLKSFSQNRLKKRRNSILSNIYRPSNQSRYLNNVSTFLNEKNLSLIKRNIKKLQTCLPYKIPQLLRKQSKKKIFHSPYKQLCKPQRLSARSSQTNDIFLFDSGPVRDDILLKKRLNSHFDRSKYFNCQTLVKKDKVKNLFHRRQKTQINVDSKITNEVPLKQRIKQYIDPIQQVGSIVKCKSHKPKTAGGFLKKYRIQELCLREDFQIYIALNQVF